LGVSLPADYHMHTPLCHHATGEPVDYAARAVELDLPEIGFSDHSPMERDDFDDWRMRFDDLDCYVEKVRQAQDRFPRLSIKLALEVDYIPGHEDWIRKLASRHRWDYFIGSVHYVADSWDFDNPKKLS
jgi:histidinol-phosphatase (PHP family)